MNKDNPPEIPTKIVPEVKPDEFLDHRPLDIPLEIKSDVPPEINPPEIDWESDLA